MTRNLQTSQSVMTGRDDKRNDPDSATRRTALARLSALWAAAAVPPLVSSCGGGSDVPAPAPPPSGQPRVVELLAGLASPWGLAFLPDGPMLVTQKAGAMVILSADGSRIESELTGIPAVDSAGQGGLLDLVLDPDYATNQRVFWTFSEKDTASGQSGTAVARGRLVGAALQEVRVIFRQVPKVGGSGHYGSRLAFRNDKTLFVTLGERQQDDPSNPTTLNAQSPANHLGKVVRIDRDGLFPADNPDFGPNAQPGLWSIGHRNPQGAAIHPVTGELWITEHGPQGGDELNRISNVLTDNRNYGWPIKSYGCPYGSTPADSSCWVGGGTHVPTYVEPVTYWVPYSIAPAGLMFYTGDKFPEWKHNAFLGALAGTALWRVELNANGNGLASTNPPSREELFKSLGERIRCVRQGPDGWIYLLTDSGKLLRVER
jgi:glucose/arabinose dehydrogenase